jgi:site-specific recombinase XerD
MRSQAVTLRIADARDAVPTLPAAVGAFLKQCEAKGLSAATVHFCRQRLETFARRTGFSDLAALTPDLVRSYLAQEREGTSPATARHGWSALSAFSQLLTGEGYLSDSPVQQVALFLSVYSTRLNRDDLHRLLKAAARRAGLTNVHPHRLRHTAAIVFLRNGGDASDLQQMLGHSDLALTRRHVALVGSDLEAKHRQASPGDRFLAAAATGGGRKRLR